MKSWIETFTSVKLAKCKDVQDFADFSLHFSRLPLRLCFVQCWFCFCFCLYFPLKERAQLSAATASQPVSALSIVRVSSFDKQNKKSRIKIKRFRGSSCILSWVEEIKLDNESRLLFGVCVLIQVQW